MSDPEKMATQFEARNEQLRHVIDVLASYEPSKFEEHGGKAEVTKKHDLEQHRVHYVLSNWNDLVRHRRSQNRSPVEPDAVKEAYEDDTLQRMAEDNEAITDGMGQVTVEVEFPLDEAFRAIKLLPGDLGVRMFAQVLEQSSELPRSDLSHLLE